MEEFGYPPVFPQEEVRPAEPTKQVDPTKRVKKVNSKVATKGGGGVHQWDIMKSLGLMDEEIKKFADSAHWLTYFPPITQADLRALGVRVRGGSTNYYKLC